MKILVAGAGGMIGGHLVNRLVNDGHEVRAVDLKPKGEWWQVNPKATHNFGTYDLRNYKNACQAANGVDQIYDLAEDMGGIGYITSHLVDCSRSIEIGMNLLRAAEYNRVPRFFFSSSACVYNTDLQFVAHPGAGLHVGGEFAGSVQPGLKESDAWPARPEEGYGLSKLYMEKMCEYYEYEGRLETRVARYHNVFGPAGSWNDGKEKAPAAICRKVYDGIHSNGKIEIWGDGKQLRSYLNVLDCIDGTVKLMNSDYPWPMNIGSDYCVSVDDLVTAVEQVANVKLERTYVPGAKGVDARNADLSLAKKELDWEPQLTLHTGLKMLYHWIREQRTKKGI